MSVTSMEMTRSARAGAALPAEVLLRADRVEGPVEYLNEVLPLLLPAYAADFVAVTMGGGCPIDRPGWDPANVAG